MYYKINSVVCLIKIISFDERFCCCLFLRFRRLFSSCKVAFFCCITFLNVLYIVLMDYLFSFRMKRRKMKEKIKLEELFITN